MPWSMEILRCVLYFCFWFLLLWLCVRYVVGFGAVFGVVLLDLIGLAIKSAAAREGTRGEEFFSLFVSHLLNIAGRCKLTMFLGWFYTTMF
jgi:hypothetical protein